MGYFSVELSLFCALKDDSKKNFSLLPLKEQTIAITIAGRGKTKLGAIRMKQRKLRGKKGAIEEKW